MPAPGQTIIIVAGAYAGSGRMSIALVAGLAFIAAVGGDNIGYAIGRLGGRRLVLRVGRYIGLTDRRLRSAEDFLALPGATIRTARPAVTDPRPTLGHGDQHQVGQAEDADEQQRDLTSESLSPLGALEPCCDGIFGATDSEPTNELMLLFIESPSPWAMPATTIIHSPRTQR